MEAERRCTAGWGQETKDNRACTTFTASSARLTRGVKLGHVTDTALEASCHYAVRHSLGQLPSMPKVVSRSAVSSSTDGECPSLKIARARLKHQQISSAAHRKLCCSAACLLCVRLPCAPSAILTSKCSADCICGEFIVSIVPNASQARTQKPPSSLLLTKVWLLCHVVRQTTPSSSAPRTPMPEMRGCSS